MIDVQLKACFKELHLPAFRETYKDQADTARAESLAYEQYLLAVADREVEARRIKRIERYRRASKLPCEKTFDNFELKRLGIKLEMHVGSLRDGSFLQRHEMFWHLATPAVVKHIFYARSGTSWSMPGTGYCFVVAISLCRNCFMLNGNYACRNCFARFPALMQSSLTT